MATMNQRTQAEGRLFNLDLPALIETGRVFPESDHTFRRVLDVACGKGEWTIEAAAASPQMQFVGIDTSPELIDQARSQAGARHLNNVSFAVRDPLHPPDQLDASFDLVNVRFVAGFLPTTAWPELISACLRFLPPGGIIRLVEGDELITTSPAAERLTDLLARALWQAHHQLFPPTLFRGKNLGQNLLITPLLPRVLRNAGVTPHQAASVTNFSAGREAHQAIATEITQVYKRIQPWLVHMGVTTQQEVEQLYRQLLVELLDEDFGGVGFYLTVWGRKP
jgi:SAM-dependent methyltransferase